MKGVDVERSVQIKSLRQILPILSQHDPASPPPTMAREVFDFLSSSLGMDDFYSDVKRDSQDAAMALYPLLKEMVREGDDPLVQALKIAGTGNIMDVTVHEEIDLLQEIHLQVMQPLPEGEVRNFRQLLNSSEYLLYLADNVGETVFDRVLIEELDVPVKYVVKGGPAMNDATYQDAVNAGIDQVAEIIETGSQTPGTYLEDCSPEFRNLFNEAGLVLSKGQANYETLDNEGEKMFFLLRAKCPIVAEKIGFPVGRLIFSRGEGQPSQLI
jgi:uncharacterized protein with ATP-grasp and redox domains